MTFIKCYEQKQWRSGLLIRTEGTRYLVGDRCFESRFGIVNTGAPPVYPAVMSTCRTVSSQRRPSVVLATSPPCAMVMETVGLCSNSYWSHWPLWAARADVELTFWWTRIQSSSPLRQVCEKQIVNVCLTSLLVVCSSRFWLVAMYKKYIFFCRKGRKHEW